MNFSVSSVYVQKYVKNVFGHRSTRVISNKTVWWPCNGLETQYLVNCELSIFHVLHLLFSLSCNGEFFCPRKRCWST